MDNQERAVAHLAAYLNTPDRSRIGNPRKNTWFVSFVESNVHELARLGENLSLLGVKYQANYAKAERVERSDVAYLATYWYDDQQRLFEAVKDHLAKHRRKLLEDLVLARGPIPKELLAKMRATIRVGKGYAYLAEKLNELDIVAGMGGKPWTGRKVLLALGPPEWPPEWTD